MDKSTECLICRNQSITGREHVGDIVHEVCDACGTYRIPLDRIKLLASDDGGRNIATYQPSEEQRRIISGFIRYTGNVLIDEYSLPTLMALSQPTLLEKTERLIAMMYRQSDSFGSEINLDGAQFTGALLCSRKELIELATQMERRGVLERAKMVGSLSCKLTYDGWLHAEEAVKQIDSNNVFIALWFDADHRSRAETAIRKAITASGMEPLTVDQDEHVEKVDDKILVDINRSRAIVADFTKHRVGVYFEAGYAMGRGLPVVWTCHSDDVDELHFDIRQYSCVVWSDPEELEVKLTARLQSLFG